jgi:ubiquinone/menaquinone biosynthesis C-methylase UbiE
MFAKNGPTFIELMQQALSSTRQGYDRLAPKFDATPFRTPDAVLEPAISAIGRVDAALDVCCGTGAAMPFLRPLCCRRLVGIDFSPGMLQEAKQRLTQVEGSAVVEFVEADVLAMTFHEEFDVAACFGALGHILPQDQPTFLRRVHRALKPGGRFVFVTGPCPPLLSRVNLILRTFNAIMKVRNMLLKPPFVMYYLTFLLPQVEELLQREGFTVEVRADLFPAPYRHFCLVIATRSCSPPRLSG